MFKRTAFIGTGLAGVLTPAELVRRSPGEIVGGGNVFSGSLASYGTDAAAGMDLVAELNENGEVFGRKFRSKYEVAASDPARAVAICRDSATEPEIFAAISSTSMDYVALEPVRANDKLPLILIGSTSPMQSLSPHTLGCAGCLTEQKEQPRC